MKRALKVFGILFGIAAVLFAASVFYYLGVTAGVSLDPEKLVLETNYLHIYDKDGHEIETAAARADVPFGDFPDYLPNAFVAVEDKRFYSHGGFDVRRILKAAAKNLASFSFREGASTISQQLIKNTHLTSEKTLSRKLKELKLTRILEKNYTKEEILELYLNSIYFGHSAFGIGSASAFYFGKAPESLTPAESALLAALVRSPNRYSPFRDPQKCLQRRNFVLTLMKDQGYLSDAQYAEALEEPLPVSPAADRSGNAFLSLVCEEVSALFPNARSGELGALRVYTAYDPALQEVLESFEADSDLALLVRDNQRDVLKAYRATAGNLKRLPASTVKPLLVYAPAIEENLIAPATPVLDQRTDFGGYCPNDAGGASGMYMSVRYALSHSVNIPAVRILHSLGVEKGVSYLEKMGLGVEREDYSLALALGGMKEGFSLPALSDGYATLANGGTYAPCGAVLRVENGNGRTVYERKTAKKRVFSEETSFLVNDMLATAAREGTAKKLHSLPFSVSAKTGTAEGKTGNLDAYTVAYTSEDVVAVWLGNRDNSPVAATGGGLPANFAKRVLEALYEKSAPAPFAPPAGVTRARYDGEEYEKNHKLILADPLSPVGNIREEYFKRDALPKETCTKFSRPTIQCPSVYLKNGTVCIVLCQAEYYDYVVKRENRGNTTTIYSGKYSETICDSSVKNGESYLYTVIPYYKGNEGAPVTLPRVRLEAASPPDDWWED